jgi:hypothetical protein
MNGNKAGERGTILQPRDLCLLRELAVMRVVDREQVKIVACFGSTTRANARLLALTRAGLLRRFFLGSGGGRKALYALSPRGAQTAGVPVRGPRRPQDTLLVADYFVSHQLAVNDIYCALKFKPISVPQVAFHRWHNFNEPLVPEISLIPDGYVEFMTLAGIVACFLEVDLGHESQAIWKGKAKRYLELALSGKYQERFGHKRFRVLVLANSARRLNSIRKTVAEITEKIFWFRTLESAAEDFFQSVWSRPTEDQPATLIEKTP